MVALFLGAAPSSYSRPLRVAFVGDPQADGMRQLEYCRKTVYKELRERKDLDLVIVLGDLVNNQVELLEPTKASLDSLPCPWFCVPGNHDRDVYPVVDGRKRPRDISTYRKVIGYEDTTFVKRGVRFILMNDVRLGGKEYEGGFRDSQKHWLDSVLRATPKNMLAVLSAHIPFTQFTAKDSLSAILAVHPNLLLMSGHTHRVGRDVFEIRPTERSHDSVHGHYRDRAFASSGRPDTEYSDEHSSSSTGKVFAASADDAFVEIPEVQAGATCGTFWLGVKGEDGFPDATMVCGSPRGYFVADFKRNGKYSLAYKKVLGQEVASVWVSGDSLLVVNVFGGAPDGRVSVRIPGRKGWLSAVREERPAPDALAVIERNKSIPRKIGKARNPEYIPMRKVNSPHVWSARLSGALDSCADRAKVGRTANPGYYSHFTAPCADSVKAGHTNQDSQFDTSKPGSVKIRYKDSSMSFKVTVPLRICP